MKIKKSVQKILDYPNKFKPKAMPFLPYDLQKKLDKYFNYKKGFFIEVGANDGYSQSNTYVLEKQRKWRGVLVEGIPELYEQCKANRKRSKIFNCALVSDQYSGQTATMHYAHLMSLVEGSLKTSQAQQEFIEAGINVQKLDGSYTVEVPVRTLESILDEVKPTRIDLLCLDVEGYEFQVLQGMNISKYHPKFIMVEARFFDEVNGLLEDKYDMIEQLTVHDFLYKYRD